MQTIENQNDTGVTMTLDDKNFINCRFKNCTLLYSGGDYAWTNTTFENCPINLAGSAQRTLNLLANFGLLKPGQVQQGPLPTPQPPTPKTEVN